MYKIYIGDITLPTNPEKLTESSERKVKDYDIIGGGIIPKLESKGLKTWKFEFDLFPNNDLVVDDFALPDQIINYIENSIKSGSVERLIISNGVDLGTTCNVYITAFTKSEIRSGEYECEINLKEYVEANSKVADIPSIQRPGLIPQPKPIPVTKSAYITKKKEAQDTNVDPNSIICSGRTKEPVNPVTNYAVYITGGAEDWVFGAEHRASVAIDEGLKKINKEQHDKSYADIF